METGEQRSLLETFVVDNPELERLELLIAEFNIFEALGAVRQELRHSDFLAFLLNPSEKHGLGDLFLKRFLIRVLSVADNPPVTPITIDVTDLLDATVEREAQNIDILIHDADSGLVCAIENKIWSGESSGQLDRYLQSVRRTFPEARAIIPVFLTPEGAPPADEGSPYIPFSYGQVGEIVEQICQAHESTLGAGVTMIMRHYVTMLRRHIVSESNIAELCRQIYRTHKAAIDLIIEHMPDLRRDLADYLIGLIKDTPSLTEVRFTKTYVDFGVEDWKKVPEFNVGVGWAHAPATIAFQFSNSPNRLGLYLLLGPVQPDDSYIRQTIFDYARTHPDVFRGCRPALARKWTRLYRMPFLGARDFEDASLDDLKQLIEPKWNQFVQEVLPRLNAHIMQIRFNQD